jgi:hypothetical protein
MDYVLVTAVLKGQPLFGAADRYFNTIYKTFFIKYNNLAISFKRIVIVSKFISNNNIRSHIGAIQAYFCIAEILLRFNNSSCFLTLQIVNLCCL